MLVGFIITLVLITLLSILLQLLYAYRTGKVRRTLHFSFNMQLGYLVLGSIFGYICGGVSGFIVGRPFTEMYGPIAGSIGGNIGGVIGGAVCGCFKMSLYD